MNRPNIKEITPKKVTSFINGNWIDPNENAKKIPIIHPADEQTVSVLYEADANEVKRLQRLQKKHLKAGHGQRQASKTEKPFCCQSKTSFLRIKRKLQNWK